MTPLSQSVVRSAQIAASARLLRGNRVCHALAPERRIFAFLPFAAAAAVVRHRQVAQQRRHDEPIEEGVVPAHRGFGLCRARR